MRKWIVVGLYVLFAIVPVLAQGDPYWLSLLSKLFINAMLAIAMWPLFILGRLNLGQAAFYGLGAYGISVMMLNGLNFWVAMPVLLVGLSILAAMIAYPSLRMTGVYFAMATFALSEIVRLTYLRFEKPFGGAQGLFNIPSASSLWIGGFEISFRNFIPQYYLIFAALVVCTLAFVRYVHSDLGIFARAVQGSAALARSLGVNTFRQEVVCFVLTCVGSAIAGALYAVYAHYLDPNLFGVMKSIDIQAYVIIGGPAHVLGPLLGTIILTLLPEVLHTAKEASPIFTGGLLLLTMFFFPTGLQELPSYVRKWTRGWRSRKVVAPQVAVKESLAAETE